MTILHSPPSAQSSQDKGDRSNSSSNKSDKSTPSGELPNLNLSTIPTEKYTAPTSIVGNSTKAGNNAPTIHRNGGAAFGKAKVIQNSKTQVSRSTNDSDCRFGTSRSASNTQPLSNNLSKGCSASASHASTSVKAESRSVQAGIAQQKIINSNPIGSATPSPVTNQISNEVFVKSSNDRQTSQKCSPEEIQRKRQEALRRRNRLKLSK